jgi:hypothetical protein
MNDVGQAPRQLEAMNWELVRVKRGWISDRVWTVCRSLLPVKCWPFRQILTREATLSERLWAEVAALRNLELLARAMRAHIEDPLIGRYSSPPEAKI